METKLHPLTEEEARIILHKGTEPPFSGEYVSTAATGTYICRQCGTPLFLSYDKFDSGCGWPSFDDAIPGRVKWTADADGIRTEITCSNCGGHLGHVFVGERETPKNARYCVNSLSMRFVPEIPKLPEIRKAYFAGGCFWCLEAVFSRLSGVHEVRSGYMGGEPPYPTYERVSSGSSGYVEAVEIAYDPAAVTYETLLDVFFATHDPTTPGRQGHDIGEQYSSVVFADGEEREAVRKKIGELEKEAVFDAPIVTEIRNPEPFYLAEDFHQRYYENHPERAYCRAVIGPKVAHLREKFSHLLVREGSVA